MILSSDYLTDNINDGIIKVDLSSWKEFSNLVTGRLLSTGNFIWRGQRSVEWLLESTWERMLKKFDINESLLNFKRFKDASKSRWEENPGIMESDDEWWALGQHYGPVTPLLEWTSAPFIAAYFAFRKDSDGQDKRAIYAFALNTVNLINKALKIKNPGTNENDLFVKYINPAFANNSRLVKRRGLFTKSPPGVDIEQWVKDNFNLVNKTNVILVKLTLPNSERSMILKVLNKMNINHSTLFPGQQKASKSKNTKLVLIKR